MKTITIVCQTCSDKYTYTPKSYRPSVQRKYCNTCRYRLVSDKMKQFAETPEGHALHVSAGSGNAGKPKPHRIGSKHPLWKGDGVGYGGIHSWIRKHGQESNRCAHCGEANKKLDWANVSQEYKRDLNDWIQLCRSCHVNYDNQVGSRWSRFKAPHPIRFKRGAVQ